MSKASLSKTERLKSRKEIEFLFKEGKRFPLHPFRVFYHIRNRTAASQVLQAGIGVSSRNFKKATDRNRIKRLCREGYRLQKQELQELLTQSGKEMRIFVIYTGDQLPEFGLVKDRYQAILKKLINLVNESITPAA